MSSWWLPQIDSRLSQGDIVETLPVGAVRHPLLALRKETVAKHGEAWLSGGAPDNEGMVDALARVRPGLAIVLSRSCDLDKQERKAAVIVAPVRAASGLVPAQHDVIFRFGRKAMMPLHEVPEIGDAYADFRMITHVSRKFFDGNRRLASMTADATKLLTRHLIGFLVEPPVPDQTTP